MTLSQGVQSARSRKLSDRNRLNRFIGLFAVIAIFGVLVSLKAAQAHPGAMAQTGSTPPPQAGPSPTGYGNLSLTDLTLMPATIQLSWTNPPGTYSSAPSGAPSGSNPSVVNAGLEYTSLTRSPGGAGFPYTLDGSTTYYDDENWSVNVEYSYQITGYMHTWTWNSGSSSWIAGTQAWAGPIFHVMVRQVGLSACQTVDSRNDPRYSTYQLQNFPFGSRIYRGGLYAGFNADNSNVGRTYLKFSGLEGPTTSGEQLWPLGGLYLYCPRLAKSGSANIQCRATVSDTWDPGTLVWGNAPDPITSGLGQSISLSWQQASPAGQWVNLNVTPDLEKALAGDGTLSLVIRPSSESGSGATTTALSTDGWAYFAKPAYQENGVSMGGYLLYAFGGSGACAVQGVSISPSSVSVSGGGSATVTVSLNQAAPAGDAVVALSSSSASVGVPSTLTIPAGSSSGTFTVSGTTAGVTATITASFGRGSASGTVTVGP